ncbi:HTH_Tnp_Tc3_2 domain-containing protein [Trichonephila clavipes]|nr:HTH_Tnp_Tc3_2 domain-containing protein [Trichonephila clavipes]
MPHRRIRAHYEQLPEFERGRIIGLKVGCWANWRIARHMGRSVAVIRRCWQEWVGSGEFQRHNGSITPLHCRARLQWCLTRLGRNHADWGRIVFSDESCFQPCPDDHRKRAWRRPGLRADSAFPIACHTGPQQEVIVWGAISFEAGSLWSLLEAHLQHIGTSTAF